MHPTDDRYLAPVDRQLLPDLAWLTTDEWRDWVQSWDTLEGARRICRERGVLPLADRIKSRMDEISSAFQVWHTSIPASEQIAVTDEEIALVADHLSIRHQPSECFPVMAYSGKDADLEESGCTGIKSIVADGRMIRVTFGGHASIGIEQNDEGGHEVMQYTSLPAEWDEDNSYTVHDEATLTVFPKRFERDNTINAGRTAWAIDRAVEAALQPFQRELTSIHAALAASSDEEESDD